MKMRMKIRLGDQKSVTAAIRALDSAEDDLERRMADFLERLTEIGRKTAEQYFSEAKYDGKNDVTVSAGKTARGWHIVAAGQSVAFMEFGSGVNMAPYPADAAVQFARGSYGKGQGANAKGWVYVGEQGTGGIPMYTRAGEERPGVYRTKGNAPAAAMYHAVRAMREAIPELAKEIFG